MLWLSMVNCGVRVRNRRQQAGELAQAMRVREDDGQHMLHH